MTEMIERVKVKSIEDYIIERQKQVEKHFTRNNEPIFEMMNSLDIAANMERVNWWHSIIRTYT